MLNRKELSPHCHESNQLLQMGTTGFVGDWWKTADYERRRRIIANAPKPTARSESAEGSGTGRSNKEIVSELRIFDIHRKAPPREHLRQTQCPGSHADRDCRRSAGACVWRNETRIAIGRTTAIAMIAPKRVCRDGALIRDSYWLMVQMLGLTKVASCGVSRAT